MIPWEEDIIIYNFVRNMMMMMTMMMILMMMMMMGIIIYNPVSHTFGQWSPSVISIIRNGFITALPWKTTLSFTNIR